MAPRTTAFQDTKPQLTHTKLSKSAIAFFAASQLCFGFNFGFQNLVGAKFRKPIILMTILMACVMIIALTLTLYSSRAGQLWMVVYVVQYIPTVLILICTKYSLCGFLTDLIATDAISDGIKNGKVGLISWLYACVMFVVKIATAIVYCLRTTCISGDSVFFLIVLHIPMLALDIIPVANILLYYHVALRVKDLKVKLERREIDVEYLRNAYRNILDCFERFRQCYDAIFVWSLLTESPKWMFMIWNHISLFKMPHNWLLFVCSYVWAMHETVQNCLPAVFAEMINVQTDATQMILCENLLIEKDKTEALKIISLLDYMKARPLLCRAWRLVPLDLRLPITVLSICTTYLIVIIQFTHLFD